MPSRAARVIAAKFFGFAPDTRGVYGSDSPSRSGNCAIRGGTSSHLSLSIGDFPCRPGPSGRRDRRSGGCPLRAAQHDHRAEAFGIRARAYTREALAAMIAQQSFDSAFLFQAETAKPAQAHPAPTRIDIQNEAPADAVSGRHLFGLDTGVQADELDVFFKHSAPQNTHALKKEPRPHLRARS